MKIFIDGDIYDESEAKISVLDHGFLYGDGVFTTIMANGTKLLFIDDHINRLFESAEIIKLKVPWSKNQVRHWAYETCLANIEYLKNSRVRINFSRGLGPDVPIDCYDQCIPSISIIVSKLSEHPDEINNLGASVLVVNLERVFPESKNFNFLPSIFSLREAREGGYYDAIFMDRDGFITEATTGNIFFIKNDVLYTTSSKVLKGVTRKYIIEAAKDSGIKIVEKMFKLSELFMADEVFISGTTKHIVPICKINQKVVGNGFPGYVTLKLKKLLMHKIEEYFESSSYLGEKLDRKVNNG
jgi:branched-chain amino acid aminotransferase